MNISDIALPWVLLVGCLAASAIGGLVAVGLDRLVQHWSARIAGRLSGLPVLVAPFGCDDCSVEDDEPHRYAGCPGNVRQLERETGTTR